MAGILRACRWGEAARAFGKPEPNWYPMRTKVGVPRTKEDLLAYELVIYDGRRQQARFSANSVAFFWSVLLT